MTVYWCELAWLGSLHGHVESGVAITIEGDRIASVERGASTPPSGSERLNGLTLPGLVNGHSHAFHRGLRGRTHGGTGTFWTWREQMYALADRLTPDSYGALATAAYAEMALAGFTMVGEFHYLHHGPGGIPYADPNEMSRVLIEAAAAAGLRITLLDTCYLQAGMTDDAELSPTQRRFSDGTAEAWAARVEAVAGSPTARVGAAVHSVRSVHPPGIGLVGEWAASCGAALHAHVSEQPAENEQCAAAFGCTPTELLSREGVLNDRFSAIHATHLTLRDLELLAESGSTCCICPTTERDLADGIGPTADFRTAGIPMTIGTDSHAVIDPFEEIRAIELNERLASLRRGTHQPGELLAIATTSGSRSLGWSEAGRIEPGALADLTTVSLDSPRLAGADPTHVAAAVVFAATAADVRHVVVGGRVIVADGVHRTIDVGAALHHSIAEVWA